MFAEKNSLSLLLTFLSVIAISQSRIINKRQTACTSADDYTPVTTDCTKFFRCGAGILYTYSCPTGTVFSASSKSCVTGTTTSCSSYTTTQCTSATDLTAVSTDCTKFNRCSNGILYIFSCPAGTIFDNLQKVCVYGSATNCQTTTTCSSAQDLTPVAGSCTMYYTCLNGVLGTQTCSTGLVFDSTNKICQDPAKVSGSCGTQPTCTTSQNLTPVSGSCTQYYLCSSGVLSILSCATGLVFDTTTKACNDPAKVTGSCGTQPTCTTSQNLTPVSGSCTQYYLCNSGVLSISTCAPGLVFDTTTKACNDPTKVTGSCGTANTTTLTCPTVDLTPYFGDCTKFYKCNNNVATVLSCPTGTVFDNVNKACNLASLSKGFCGSISGYPNCPTFTDLSTYATYCSASAFKLQYPNCC